MAGNSTVPDLKRAFLKTQVRLLSAPLDPPADWREYNATSAAAVTDTGDLSEKVVGDVLGKANALLRSRNAAAFPASALSHVAAQIDALYWANTAPDEDSGRGPDDVLERGADLTQASIIAGLPEEWPDEDENENEDEDEDDNDEDDEDGNDEDVEDGTGAHHGGDDTLQQNSKRTTGKRKSAIHSRGTKKKAKRRTTTSSRSRVSGLESFAESVRYRTLRQRVLEADAERRQARARLARVKSLRKACESFEGKDEARIQEGLVVGRAMEEKVSAAAGRDEHGRGGGLGLSGELERMRVLMARVGGRIGGLD